MLRKVLAGCAVLAAAVSLAACTGTDAVDQSGAGSQFRFVSVTKTGSLIPVADRKPAGTISGELLGGGTYSLTQDAGKPVVLNWFGSWCGPCQTETPAFAKYYEQVRSSTQFVGIDAKDQKSAGQSFVKDSAVTYPVIFDQPLRTALQLGKNVPVSGFPFTAIVDKHQKVAAFYLGAVQPADLSSALGALATES